MSPSAKRLLIASLVAAVIVFVSLRTAWRGSSFYLCFPQRYTVDTITWTDDAIKKYRKDKGTLPDSLKQLPNVSGQVPYFDDNRQVRDSWDHPLVYAVNGDSYRLVSYGRDGKPGGIGLDYDIASNEISNGNLRAPMARLPFSQFFTHPAVRGVVWTSLICGAVVFLLTLKVVRPDDLSLRESGFLAFKLLVTLIASLAVATIMSILHIPSGH